LLFMRAVRSRVLFEQMLGRGTRVISETDFQSVTTTPQAHKTRFVIVDAVGVTEQELIETGTVDRKRSIPLKSLLESVALGAVDDDLLGSLARRLGMLAKRISPSQVVEIAGFLDVLSVPERFKDLRELSNAMLDAIDPDAIYAQAVELTHNENPSEAELQAAHQVLVERAIMPLASSPELRSYLQEREILIDETSLDAVISQESDQDATVHARQLIGSFQEFIQVHRDEITALQILFNRPYAHQQLDFPLVRQLAEHLCQDLKSTDPLFVTQELWQAYMQLEKDHVRGAGEKRVLADLVSLVRHAAMSEELIPYPERVERRYREWLSEKDFTPQERVWLDEIARHIGINVSISVEDLNYFGFRARGGEVAALRLFGAKLSSLLKDLNATVGM